MMVFTSSRFFWKYPFSNLPKIRISFENRKSEHHHWIFHIRVNLDAKCQLKLTILIFWIKFAQKRYFQSKRKNWTLPLNFAYFWSKTEKVNITIEFCIFELVGVPNFTLNKQFWILASNLPEKGISGREWKEWTS